jgi:hypothetical protein
MISWVANVVVWYSFLFPSTTSHGLTCPMSTKPQDGGSSYVLLLELHMSPSSHSLK